MRRRLPRSTKATQYKRSPPRNQTDHPRLVIGEARIHPHQRFVPFERGSQAERQAVSPEIQLVLRWIEDDAHA